MSKSLSTTPDESKQEEPHTVSLPKTTAPYEDMDTADQNKYIQDLIDATNDYCDRVGC